jgi:YidC/Oxa1 family membrane protein insertase
VDNKRVLLAVLLSVVIIVGWQLVFPPPKPPKPGETAPAAGKAGESPAGAEAGKAAAGSAGTKAGTEATEAAGSAEKEPAASQAPDQVSDRAPVEAPPAEPVGAERESRTTLAGPGFRAIFSNRGATLVSYQLPGYEGEGGAPVDLVRDRTGLPYPFALVDSEGRALEVDQVLFAVDEGKDEKGRPSVSFTYSGPAGRVTKRFTVLPMGMMALEIDAETKTPWSLVLGPGLRNPTASDESRKFKYRGAVYRLDGKVKTVAPEKDKETAEVAGSGLSWVGLQDTYFLAAVIPETPVRQATITPWLVVPKERGGPPAFERMPAEGPGEEQKDLRRELRVILTPDGTTFAGQAYFGAKDLELLGKLPAHLDETVQLGWFGFLARGLLVGLKWIYSHVVPNYGWAIVLLTLLIKLVLLPLTHKSYVSMQKMQEVAPQIKAIRNKYKGKKDKKGRPDLEAQRKMNEEVAALYRKEGVNPAGGCLPMLIQFPVLFAFYRLLSHAVELRGAPWIFWIHDLSMHDPTYILPLVMGGAQLLQQWTAPSGGDPKQRKMMMLMPIFFTVLFLGFPSGLVLYWLTNNLLTLLQQGLIQRMMAKKAAAAQGQAAS